MVNVLFFAQLKELLGSGGMNLDIVTPCTVNDVKTALIEHNQTWAGQLNQATIMCAVNQTMVEGTHPVKDGDEVAFFPPVTGG